MADDPASRAGPRREAEERVERLIRNDVRKDILGRPIAVSEPKMTTDPDAFGPINFYGCDVQD